MTRAFRLLVAVVLTVTAGFGAASSASADFEDSDGTNQQDGDNAATSDQGGASASGDAVGGQVTGIVSAGQASVDATNRSEDVDVRSGDTIGSNFGDSFVGHDFTSVNAQIGAPDFEGSAGVNQQEGDNSLDLTQTVDASSGDAVGGQVIGAVTSAGGGADIVADNASEDVDVTTGNAEGFNDAFSFAGLQYFALSVSDVVRGDFESSDGINQQDGSNDLSVEQAAAPSSGDGVAGQVIGVVSAGDTSVDARNRSEDVDVDTGLAFNDNVADSFTGLQFVAADVDIGEADFEDSTAANQQDGDNSLSLSQTSTATSGDGVGGQVIGVVTSTGGSADIVADNASEDVEIETGRAVGSLEADSFVGLQAATVDFSVFAVNFEFSTATHNQQDGDNSLSAEQSADASSGDGVGGQVIGAVSAGATQVDARNRSEDVDITTGPAEVGISADSFVGLQAVSVNFELAVDFASSSAINQQDGDNALDLAQAGTATSGDGVGGQVIGAVTSATGSTDIVADNASEDVEVETGGAFATNRADSFVGLEYLALDFTLFSLGDFEGSTGVNQQDGDNDFDLAQTADAASGDGVAGQVIGAVSAGDTRVDARNRSEDVDLETGLAVASNFAESFVGLHFSSVNVETGVGPQDFDGTDATNQQEGDNAASLSQAADASSGDAVGGQVVGVVTSVGGSVDAVVDNASSDVELETGESFQEHFDDLFVGLSFGTLPLNVEIDVGEGVTIIINTSS